MSVLPATTIVPTACGYFFHDWRRILQYVQRECIDDLADAPLAVVIRDRESKPVGVIHVLIVR
jgi:hypothetical protein